MVDATGGDVNRRALNLPDFGPKQASFRDKLPFFLQFFANYL